MTTKEKKYGQVYTPRTISSFLVKWAIKSNDDTILEPSVGRGKFVFDAYDRLRNLGAAKEDVRKLIFGFDIDEKAVNALQSKAKDELGTTFPNIKAGNLFNVELPKVKAIIGNPPYVIRHRFENPEDIINKYVEEYGFSDQADLYCYFIAKAVEALEPNGRFAMIVSNSWMKKVYGEEFKSFLLEKFYLDALIGFKERVFPNRLVNSACILGRKKQSSSTVSNNSVIFTQVESPDTLSSPDILNSRNDLRSKAVHTAFVSQSSVNPKDYWDIWLRAPRVFDSIKSESKFVPLKNMATPMIGVQTLAKRFFIFSKADIEKKDIEQKFLRPLAYSPRDHQKPILSKDECRYLFWCPKDKNELNGTNALRHIEKAEQKTVKKRYGEETYKGLHNKPRIREASRSPWYNLTDEAKKRLPAQILLPRRVYKNYMAVWNKVKAIPNENFLTINVDSETHVKPLLAYLNSSLGELCLRLSGHVYGGGVCDLNVSSAKNIQTIDLNALTRPELEMLEEAFDKFTKVEKREVLNNIIYKIVDFGKHRRREIEEALELSIEESTNK